MISFQTLRQGLFTFGKVRHYRFDVKENPVHVVFRGPFAFKDQEAVSVLSKIVKTQREFFNDQDFPHYFISLLSAWPGCCKSGGTGVRAGFAGFLSSGFKFDQDVIKMLAHELFHTWNGRKIRRQEPEELMYWFSEGFTTYYARTLALRAGLLTLDDVVSDVNRTIREFMASPKRNVSNADVQKFFWKDPEVEKTVYRRGDLLALLWNLRVKQATGGRHSLDSVMRDLLREASTVGTVASNRSIERFMKKYVSSGIGDEIAKVVEAGGDPVISPRALGPCVTLGSEGAARARIPQYKVDRTAERRDPKRCLDYFR
jgi:predicted metalloprotease with PDZ domain